MRTGVLIPRPGLQNRRSKPGSSIGWTRRLRGGLRRPGGEASSPRGGSAPGWPRLRGEAPDPDFQNRPAIGEPLEAADFVTGAFGRQTDRKNQRRAPRDPGDIGQIGLEYVGIDILLDDALEQKDQQQQDDRRNIDAAEIRNCLPIRAEAAVPSARSRGSRSSGRRHYTCSPR